MMKPWIPIDTYVAIMKQAANNNGKAFLEAKGCDPLEILIDVEYAKKEWSEFEKIINKFNEIPN